MSILRSAVLLATLAAPIAVGAVEASPVRSVPDIEVDRGSLTMVGAVLYRHGTPFSGYAVARQAGRIVSRTPLLEGREHGRAVAWYPNGAKRFEKHYVHGNREGTHRGWWDNGRPQFVYRYVGDLFEGEQVAFYRNGVRSELRHYTNGREEGQQRFWNDAGRVVANYAMVNGKRYGIVGRRDCVPVRGE